MGAFLVTLFMFILVLTAGLMTIIILMQKPSANAGMGAALGGGAAESFFGGETANVLLKYTIWVAVAFFVLSFGLYLGIMSRNHPAASNAVEPPSSLLAPTPAAGASGNATTATPSSPAATGSASTDKSPAPAAMPAAATSAPATTVPAPAASSNTPSAAVPASTAAPADTSAPATTSAPADTTAPAGIPPLSP